MLENFIPSLRLSRDSLEELATRVRRAKYHPTEEELRIFSRYYAGMNTFPRWRFKSFPQRSVCQQIVVTHLPWGRHPRKLHGLQWRVSDGCTLLSGSQLQVS